MRKKKLVSAMTKIIGAELVLTAACIPVAYAQSQPDSAAAPTAASTPATTAPPVSKLEKVEVTGSLIRTSDKVGNTEVQTITQKDIQQSGYTTVADFLRGLSVNNGSSFSQNTPSTTAPGGAGIALRGVSEKYTLVLIDGQRVANYANPVNFTDTFFDVNAVPLNIVDHIEVVKTGAVSEYGSDAIAGVVNIITKKNFKGLEIDGEAGKAQHPGDATGRFSVLGGFGDLGSDRFNVTASANWYRDTGSTLADRPLTSAQDFTRFDGGQALPLGPNQQQNFTLPDGTTVPISPCPPQTSLNGQSCVHNTAAQTSLIPSTTRLNATLRGTFQVNDNLQAYASMWVSRDETVQLSGPPTISSTSNVFNPATGSVQQLPRTVPASNPFNPFGVPVQLNYPFVGETGATDTVSTFWKASTGVKGSFSTPKAGDWDWGVDAIHSQSTVDSTFSNVLAFSGLQSVLNGGFNFANPAASPNGMNGLFADDDQQAISKVDSVTAHASTGNLFTLPTGSVGLGLGTEFRHESSLINPRTLSSQGIVFPANVQEVNGSRNVAAVYYQVDVPIVRNLTFTQSGRYDHYSDFGGAFSPNFALRFQPVQALTTFASYARGFRAPTLVENSQADFLGHQTLTDPNDPSGVPTKHFTTEVTNGNRNLQPEHTKNYNIGFELSPDSTTDIGGSFYKLQIDGVIGSNDPNAVLVANDPSLVVRNPDGSIRFINQQFVNLGSLDTDGFDMNFRKSLNTKYGTFTLAGDWTYVWHFKLNSPGQPTQDFAGNNFALLQPFGSTNPRWKGNTSLTWDYNKFTTTFSWLYTGPYTNAVSEESGETAGLSVASYSQFNLVASYRGFKHWTIYGGITNLFDREPPFDSQNEFTPSLNGYDSSLYTDLGRTFQIGATYRF